MRVRVRVSICTDASMHMGTGEGVLVRGIGEDAHGHWINAYMHLGTGEVEQACSKAVNGYPCATQVIHHKSYD